MSENPASWLTLVMQGGALVLLGYALIFTAPKVMEENRKERVSRDQLFAQAMTTMNDRFESRTTLMNERFESRNALVVQAITLQTDALKKAIENICHYRNSGPCV